MGFLGDLGKELGKAALQGIAEGIEKSQQQKAAQERQAQMQNFAANEQAIQNAAEQGDLEAIQEMVIACYQQGDYQNAAYWGRKGAAVNDATCLYFMGEIAFAQEDYRAAENFWTRNANTNGDGLSATALGNLYLGADDLSSAEYYFDFALRRDNSNPEAALGLAICKSNDDNADINQIKQLLQIAARSEIYSTRNAANDLLKDIRQEEAENARQQQNSGCFITTAVCDSFGKPDDCEELTTFRKFRDGWLANQPDGKSLIAEYYSIAPRIVNKINLLADAAQIYKSIWQSYLEPCLNFIKRGDNIACKNKYIDMVRELKKTYA